MRRFLINHGLRYLAISSLGILGLAVISFIIALIFQNDAIGFIFIIGIPIAFLLGLLNRVLSLWLHQDMKQERDVNVPIVVGIIYFIFIGTVTCVAHRHLDAKKGLLLFHKHENSSTNSSVKDKKINGSKFSQSQIIEVATEFAKTHTDLENRTCKFDSDNKEWIKLASQPDKEVAHGIMINELKGRNYQSIKFELNKIMLGGDFWVFINIGSGEVITYYGEQ